jgi:nucleolar protein 15
LAPQFGSVTNIRLGRSKKTGASRGFAFVEFRYADVAKIVAETMNNYLMFEKLLKCKVVPAGTYAAAIKRAFFSRASKSSSRNRSELMDRRRSHPPTRMETRNFHHSITTFEHRCQNSNVDVKIQKHH